MDWTSRVSDLDGRRREAVAPGHHYPGLDAGHEARAPLAMTDSALDDRGALFKGKARRRRLAEGRRTLGAAEPFSDDLPAAAGPDDVAGEANGSPAGDRPANAVDAHGQPECAVTCREAATRRLGGGRTRGCHQRGDHSKQHEHVT